MKIIEAMKRVKANKEKIQDLQAKLAQFCANLDYETLTYGSAADTSAKITDWLNSCTDLTQENIRLLVAVQRTNNATDVTITLGEKSVTKTIAEWVWRRREYAALDLKTPHEIDAALEVVNAVTDLVE